MVNYYDEIATGYEELHKEEQLKKIELIKKYFRVKKAYRLLDVGCGTGLTTEPWNCIRYGIDPSKKLLDRARHKDEIKYKLASAENIPYEDHFFDIVISITAIQNFDDIEKGLKEIKRVGKEKFILSFLKKSPKRYIIEDLIEKIFDAKEFIEIQENQRFFEHQKSKKILNEEKDIIFIITE
jgi:ubiquinone/menaquinone biosynthesis C-methylase UbiE